jgi:hypothetical protein
MKKSIGVVATHYEKFRYAVQTHLRDQYAAPPRVNGNGGPPILHTDDAEYHFVYDLRRARGLRFDDVIYYDDWLLLPEALEIFEYIKLQELTR